MKQTEAIKSAVKLDEAASILGVSSATVRNWIKQKYLVSLNKGGTTPVFDRSQVSELKEKISSGTIKRLDKRANKSNSKQTFIPDEYAADQIIIETVQTLVPQYESANLDKKSFLFSLILNLLERKNLISFHKDISNFSCKNEFIAKEVEWWFEKTKTDFCLEKYSAFLKIENLPQTNDLLGIIYQSLTSEGSKSEGGSYYTPKFIVDEIVNDYVQKNSSVVDPCCGTGRFLVSAARKNENPQRIWGFDIDEIVVRLARINMFLEFPEIEFTPHIYCTNILQEVKNTLPLYSDFQIPKFDVVLTNPPWGGHFSKADKQQLEKLYPEIKSGESFSYFIKAGLDLLKDDGILSFILPEALLNIKTHKDIREIILKQTKIKKVILLDRIFKNVFTPVFRMDFQKTEPSNSNIISVQNGEIENRIAQSRFLKNSDFRFDVLTNDADISLFEKIYNVKHLTLENNAEWALGIVTGNNKKYISENKTPLTEPILTGKNIKRFITNSPTKTIEFVPENFQQVAPEHKYRAKKKLIYKFISKQLVFAYDDQQTLTLNSANCLIPKFDYPIKTILALFNSSLYQFLYQKKFGSLKILRGEIEQLPLPIIKESQHKNIEVFVNKLLKKDIESAESKVIQEKINEYICDLFELNSQEKEHIKNSQRKKWSSKTNN